MILLTVTLENKCIIYRQICGLWRGPSRALPLGRRGFVAPPAAPPAAPRRALRRGAGSWGGSRAGSWGGAGRPWARSVRRAHPAKVRRERDRPHPQPRRRGWRRARPPPPSPARWWACRARVAPRFGWARLGSWLQRARRCRPRWRDGRSNANRSRRDKIAARSITFATSHALPGQS